MAYIYSAIAMLTEIAYAVWFGAGFISVTVRSTILYEQIPDKSVMQVWD